MPRPLLTSLFDEIERRPLSVSELTTQVRGALESRFASVWVEGEISNFHMHSSGHWYFTIKDEAAQLHATCFRGVNGRIRFRPSDGLYVRAGGRITVYEPRGEYQLKVESLVPHGEGALKVAFEQMRDRLDAEGLFAAELKRPLPLFPRRVAVVTSLSGAALSDILTIIRRRTRTVHVLVVPARVQGEGAGAEIASAIRLLNKHHRNAVQAGNEHDAVDVLIVGRGGGSAEDLWAFNEEVVARAIRASEVPVVSAVGHETDFTIADLTADLRAPTPSAAAELVAAREDELEARVRDLTYDLVRTARLGIAEARARVQDAAMSPGFDEARARLHRTTTRCCEITHRLDLAMRAAVQRARLRSDGLSRRLSPVRLTSRHATAKTRLALACGARDAAIESRRETARASLGIVAAALDALSPLGVLKRGYALAYDSNGKLLHSARNVSAGDVVRVRLSEGALGCRVEQAEDL